jgi:hypothetical protein
VVGIRRVVRYHISPALVGPGVLLVVCWTMEVESSFFWVVKKRSAARSSLSGLMVCGCVRDGQGLLHSEELDCVLTVSLGGAGGTAAARVGSRRRPMVARTEMRGIVKRRCRRGRVGRSAKTLGSLSAIPIGRSKALDVTRQASCQGFELCCLYVGTHPLLQQASCGGFSPCMSCDV